MKARQFIFRHKRYWLWLIMNSCMILLIWMICYEVQNLMNLINALFFVTIFYMIIFLYLFLMRGRFFDGIVYSFRKVFEQLSNNQDDREEGEKLLPSETFHWAIFIVCKQQFWTMAFILLLLQGVYFMI